MLADRYLLLLTDTHTNLIVFQEFVFIFSNNKFFLLVTDFILLKSNVGGDNVLAFEVTFYFFDSKLSFEI